MCANKYVCYSGIHNFGFIIIHIRIGRPKHVKVMTGALQGEFFVGNRAEELRGLLKLKYPMDRGIVKDWDDMTRVWNYVYEQGLEISQREDHPVLLTEAPLNPKSNQEKTAEIFFETFNCPALFFSIQAILSLYASGNTTGVVLDTGEGVSHAVPIINGFAIPSAITRIEVAGKDVTRYLQTLLRKSGYVFHTSAEMEIVRAIKESKHMHVGNAYQFEHSHSDVEKLEYKLPDGTIIKLDTERFKAPEILFKPHLLGLEYMGLHECITTSIESTDLDLRRTLYASIALSGGSTLFQGFGDRMLQEVKKLAPKDTRVRISSPPERKYSAWIGGSILASLSTFATMWTSAKEYREDSNCLFKKSFLF